MQSPELFRGSLYCLMDKIDHIEIDDCLASSDDIDRITKTSVRITHWRALALSTFEDAVTISAAPQ